MQIIQENIQDNLQNYTRFLLLKKGNRTQNKSQTHANTNSKYTLAIRFVNEYKSLTEVLKLILLNNRNLISLLGRPIINTKWEELFF